jgi:hypothetical protein
MPHTNHSSCSRVSVAVSLLRETLPFYHSSQFSSPHSYHQYLEFPSVLIHRSPDSLHSLCTPHPTTQRAGVLSVLFTAVSSAHKRMSWSVCTSRNTFHFMRKN